MLEEPSRLLSIQTRVDFLHHLYTFEKHLLQKDTRIQQHLYGKLENVQLHFNRLSLSFSILHREIRQRLLADSLSHNTVEQLIIQHLFRHLMLFQLG